MRKQPLAALAAVAALAVSGASWSASSNPPLSYNTSGDSAMDARSNAMVNGNGAGYQSSNGASNGTRNGGGSTYGSTGSPHGGGSGAYDATGQHAGEGGEAEILKHGTGVSHLALLDGGNEVSKDGKADAGDEDGRGAASLSIDPEAGSICFGLVVNNIDGPVAAHIHQGKAGHNGPVVIALKAPGSGNPGAASGCVWNVDRALLHAIHAHPWAYYVNVHSSAYPDGAIRGQVF